MMTLYTTVSFWPIDCGFMRCGQWFSNLLLVSMHLHQSLILMVTCMPANRIVSHLKQETWICFFILHFFSPFLREHKSRKNYRTFCFLIFNIHLKHVQTVSALTFSHEKIQHSIKYLWCLLYVTDAIPVNNYFPVLDLTVRCSLQGSSSWDDFDQFSSDDSLSRPVEGQGQFVDHFS